MTDSYMQSLTGEEDGSEGIGFLPVVTLVLWLFCLIVGGIGLYRFQARAKPATTEPARPAIVAVDLSKERPPPRTAAPAAAVGPPMAEDRATVAILPAALPEVAAPSPSIGFAIPVQGLVRLVPAAQAAGAAPARPMRVVIGVTPLPPVQQLTFGVGQGQQPAPEYPRQAEIAHQEGTVVVRFTVGEDGSVVEASAIHPCQWPLLNRSALRKIREDWRYPPGPVRVYEISIEYQGRQH